MAHPGVTIVQYRDKTSDTAEQIATAKKLHQITKAHNVPLLINDRVDVAIAAGVEGVHLGQDDMSMFPSMTLEQGNDTNTLTVITEAKKILPKDAIIGISAASVDEAQKAIDAGADYLGIGTMFATPTYVVPMDSGQICGC